MKKFYSSDASREGYRMAAIDETLDRQREKRQSREDRLNEALVDLLVALDVIEEALLTSCNYCRKSSCPTCAAAGWHSRTCKGAALLRKYGRMVSIEGDKK